MENRPEPETKNIITIDWLSVTFHQRTPQFVIWLLGMDDLEIKWIEEVFYKNGYTRKLSFGNITIRYNAYSGDTSEETAGITYDSETGVYTTGDTVSLEMTGQGCRTFGDLGHYGNADWIKLIADILALDTKVNFTRIDFAYDDKEGLLDMDRIMEDARLFYWTGPSTKRTLLDSGDQKNNIFGATVYIGSKKSDIYLCIYDKAAEREYEAGELQWVRVELRLRHERAHSGAIELLNNGNVGYVLRGLLRNYCCFRVPSGDSNKSRWPISPYWEKLLDGVGRIRLFTAPGIEYNYRKTRDHMIFQYGQAMQVEQAIYGDTVSFMHDCRQAYPKLKPKYEKAIAEAKAEQEILRLRKKLLRQAKENWQNEQFGKIKDDNFEILRDQIDMSDIFPDIPGAAGPRYKIPE